MQAVLYTQDMEPITVVDLPTWVWEKLERGDQISIAVMNTPLAWFKSASEPPDFLPPRVVHIYGEMFVRRGKRMMFLFTSDDESALLLKADFLPGQRGELQDRQRRAFSDGFMKALINYRE